MLNIFVIILPFKLANFKFAIRRISISKCIFLTIHLQLIVIDLEKKLVAITCFVSNTAEKLCARHSIFETAYNRGNREVCDTRLVSME